MLHNKLVGSSNEKIHVKSCRTFWYGKQMLVIVILKKRQGGVLCYHLTPLMHSAGKSLFTIRPEFDHFSAPLPWCRAPSISHQDHCHSFPVGLPLHTFSSSTQQAEWFFYNTTQLIPLPCSKPSEVGRTLTLQKYLSPNPQHLWICSLTGPKGLCRCD